jgi:hypothetical protein
MIIAPAVHILKDYDGAREQKGWKWYRVSELVEAANWHLPLSIQTITPTNLYGRYGYLNDYSDSLGLGIKALPTRKGEFGDHPLEFITPNIDLTNIAFIPADWGYEILNAIKHPIISRLCRRLRYAIVIY